MNEMFEVVNDQNCQAEHSMKFRVKEWEKEKKEKKGEKKRKSEGENRTFNKSEKKLPAAIHCIFALTHRFSFSLSFSFSPHGL